MRKLDEHGAVLGGRGYSRLAFSPVGTDCPLCEALDGLVFWKGAGWRNASRHRCILGVIVSG